VFVVLQSTYHDIVDHDTPLFLQIAADVMVTSKDEVWLNMFVVDCKSIQDYVNKKALLFAKELLKQQLEAAFQRNTEICQKFQTMSDTLTKYSIGLLFVRKIAFISQFHQHM